MNRINRALSDVGWWDWWEPRYGAVRHRVSLWMQRRVAALCWRMGTSRYGRGEREEHRWIEAARILRRPRP